jgi:hypothetical protein
MVELIRRVSSESALRWVLIIPLAGNVRLLGKLTRSDPLTDPPTLLVAMSLSFVEWTPWFTFCTKLPAQLALSRPPPPSRALATIIRTCSHPSCKKLLES